MKTHGSKHSGILILMIELFASNKCKLDIPVSEACNRADVMAFANHLLKSRT